jgi:hypothetical protein
MKSRIIIFIGMLLYILFFSSCISIKPTYTNKEDYFSSVAQTNDLSIYNGVPSEGILPVFYSKSHLENCYHLYRLALTSFKGDTIYDQIEMHGAAYNGKKSIVLLCYDYKNKMVDIYHPLDLNLTAANYVDMLNHVEVYPKLFDASFGVDELGYYMKMSLTDKYGRIINIDIREDKPIDKSLSIIAPVGAGSEHPKNFPFTFIDKMGLARKDCGKYLVSIGDKEMRPAKIPFTPYLLTRYSLETTIAEWLPNTDTEIRVGELPLSTGNSFQTINNNGYQELTTETFDFHGRKMYVNYCPPIPDLAALRNNQKIEGRFIIETDSVTGVMAGVYRIEKTKGTITLQIDPKKGWQPMPGKLWMTTYHWNAELTLVTKDSYRIKSEWKRTK